MTSHLSHSQMETFQQCPRRYRLERLDRVPRAPAPALLLGDAFHAGVEADGRAHLEGQPRLTLVQLLRIGILALNKRMAEDDPNDLLSQDDVADMEMRLSAMLRAYVERIQPSYQPIAVERTLTAPLMDGWQFTGRLDAITERGIVDLKTASKPWPIGAEHEKAQATAYYWLAWNVDNEEGWEWMPSQCTFLVFATMKRPDGTYTCDVQRRVTTRSRERQIAWADQARVVAGQIAEARKMGDYPANPSPLCGWCGVRGSCREGREYLRVSGRVPAVPEVTP